MVKVRPETWHAQDNTKHKDNTSGIMEHINLKEENMNLPSPSKSLQTTALHRDSINSNESRSSIKVEYESATDIPQENTGSSRSANNKTKSGVISSIFKPKLFKPRSSLYSSNSTENVRRERDDITTKLRQSTIEDFADTSSEEENTKQYIYDAESINSILEEYEMKNSLYGSPTKKTDFIFNEDFNSSSDLNKPRELNANRSKSTRNSGVHTPTRINSRNPSIRRNNRSSIIERTLGNRSSQSSSGHSGLTGVCDYSKGNGTNSEFKIYIDEQNEGQSENRRKVDRRNIISTSSNIDVFNRTSLSNLTTLSDIDYNDDNKQTAFNTVNANNSFNTHRQIKRQSDNRLPFDVSKNILESKEYISVDFNVLERVLLPCDRTGASSGRFPNTSLINMDETAIKNNTRDVTRSSISTNELLNKLETFYDNDNDNNTQESIPHTNVLLSTTKNNILGETDLTAGIDSKTILPLYKVQNMKFNERHNRRSVEEKNLPTRVSRKKESPESLSNIYPSSGNTSMSILEPSKSRLGQYSTTGSIPSSSRGSPLYSNAFLSRGSANSNFSEKIPVLLHNPPRGNSKQSYDSIQQVTANNFLHDTLPKNYSHEHMLNNAPCTNYNAINTSYEDLEKGGLKPKINGVPYNTRPTHTWPFFILIMILGLVVPPIYILLAVGFFDNNNKNANYREFKLQLTHLVVNPNQNKRFSKTQKFVSITIGFIWLCIVLAMIGVGLKLGIKRES